MTKTWTPISERTYQNSCVVQYVSTYTSAKYPGVSLTEQITCNGVTTRTRKSYKAAGCGTFFYTLKDALAWQTTLGA